MTGCPESNRGLTVYISTPMPLAGHDNATVNKIYKWNRFLLPCPSRGMTDEGEITLYGDVIFLLPCPSRGMTTNNNTDAQNFEISTPMPLAGHDYYGSAKNATIKLFLLPCPSRGMTKFNDDFLPWCPGFLLPCPSRGMTQSKSLTRTQAWDFYSHAPRGA